MRFNGRKPHTPTLSFGIQAPRRNSQSNGILSHRPRTLFDPLTAMLSSSLHSFSNILTQFLSVVKDINKNFFSY